jgi:hypothetical protein
MTWLVKGSKDDGDTSLLVKLACRKSNLMARPEDCEVHIEFAEGKITVDFGKPQPKTIPEAIKAYEAEHLRRHGRIFRRIC